MPDSYIQVPADSSGKKTRTRELTIGANVVHEQATFQAGLPTYYALADALVFAQNKHHISIFNGVGSGKIIKIRKVFTLNLAVAAITGVMVRFDYKRTTAQSAGTAITAQKADTNDPDLPTQILIATGATITEGALLWPFACSNDEVGATQAFPSTQLLQGFNWMPEGVEVKELCLREGQGLTIKQITSTTVGTFGWLIVFTVE